MIKHTPQFDVENITLGSAYWLTKSSATILNGHLDAPAIVTEVEPFTISFSHYCSKRNGTVALTLDILDVINNVYYLTPMIKENIINVSFKKFNEAIPRGSKEDKEGF